MNLVILISGGGSNMQAIVAAEKKQQWRDKLGVHVACVISNRPDAAGLDVADRSGIATKIVDHQLFETRSLFEAELKAVIDGYEPVLVVLAGFMRILTPTFVKHFAGRLINIHPSLLPAFAGLNTHQRAIDAGCTVAGATVHFVTAQVDHGRIVAQAVVPVLLGDTALSLSQRVLAQEHVLYPKAISALLATRKTPASQC